jgi:hypothetical protein
MIERLIKLKKCKKLALADLGKSDLYSEEMFIALEDILKILKLTELAVKELSKDEATLLTSEGVFLFLFKKLRGQNTDLSNELLDALKKRFVERRNKDLVSLLRYLQNPTLPRAEKNDEISYSSKTAIISTAKKILQRNFSSDFALSKTSTQSTETVPVIATVGNTINESSSTSTEKMDLATELHSSIASVMLSA